MMSSFPHRIGALDLSLTGTGIGTHDVSGIRLSTVDGTKLRGHQRLNAILTAVAELRECALVLVEGQAYGAKGNSVLDLAELHGIVKHWLYLRRVPYLLVPPTVLKTYALGKGGGKDTGKEQVLLAVERRYGLLATVEDNNQADTLVLLAMALDYYGNPLAPVPAAHRAALTKVRGWPDLDPGPAGETWTPPADSAPARSLP